MGSLGLRATFKSRLQDEFLILEDRALETNAMSITNNAEEVVRWAVENITGWKRILYLDTMGRWDELAVRDGIFAGFKPNGAKELIDAIRVARKNTIKS